MELYPKQFQCPSCGLLLHPNMSCEKAFTIFWSMNLDKVVVHDAKNYKPKESPHLLGRV